MSGSEVTLEMFPGLEAPGKARARLASAFADRIDAERLINLQVVASELIALAVRTDRESWIGLRVREEDGVLLGVVSDGRFADALPHEGGAGRLRLARRMIDAVTREWGTRENEAWFRV
jgi:hypothetical protein